MDEIAAIPPILLIATAVLLGLFVIVTVVGRFMPSLYFIWRDRGKIHDSGHIVQYTLTPALFFMALTAVIIVNWDPGADLKGGWTTRDLLVGPGLILMGFVVVVAAQVLSSRVGTSDNRQLVNLIPYLLVLSAIWCLNMGVNELMEAHSKYKNRRNISISILFSISYKEINRGAILPKPSR